MSATLRTYLFIKLTSCYFNALNTKIQLLCSIHILSMFMRHMNTLKTDAGKGAIREHVKIQLAATMFSLFSLPTCLFLDYYCPHCGFKAHYISIIQYQIGAYVSSSVLYF